MRRSPVGLAGSRALDIAAAVAGPVVLTVALNGLAASTSRDYVFLYLGLVAVLGVTSGLIPALLCATVSFLLVDYYFVPPIHTLTIADETDVVNLLVFLGVAGAVGGLGSLRRRAQHRAEALSRDLRTANLKLERLNEDQAEAAKVAVRLSQTERQVAVLEETDRLRRDLLGNISHELRTPLGTILTGTTELAGREDLPAEAREELRTIVSETRRLGRLVTDMLDLTRIEGHALDLRLEEVDLDEAIRAAVERLHVLSPHRVVQVEVLEGQLEVVADWDRLGQILDNLLVNADRHAPPGTPITVRAMSGKRGMAVVGVIDRGAGVPPGLRDHVFDRFARGSAGNGASSTGLGLAIVRGLAEAHAGRAWLEESEPGEGAHFAFSLPMATAAENED